MSLRQVLNIFINKVMEEEEVLLRSEQHKIVNHILDNSVLKLSSEKVELFRGNYLGIDKYGRDRELRLPRFMIFSFSKIDESSYTNNAKRTWHLQSFIRFEELESALSLFDLKGSLVMIDNEIVDYELCDRGGYSDVVRWGRDIYKISYLLDDKEHREVFNNKEALEIYMCVIARKQILEMTVHHLISNRNLNFRITDDIYTTQEDKNTGCKVVWIEESKVSVPFWGSVDSTLYEEEEYDEEDYEDL